MAVERVNDILTAARNRLTVPTVTAMLIVKTTSPARTSWRRCPQTTIMKKIHFSEKFTDKFGILCSY